MNQKIVWDTSFATGISEIDEQHQRLIEIINDLAEAIGVHASKTQLMNILQRLKEYTEYHFTAEERLMDQAGYPGLDGHRKEHRTFVDQIELFDLDVLLATEGLAWDMFHFLRQWLVNHILAVDKEFALSIRA